MLLGTRTTRTRDRLVGGLIEFQDSLATIGERAEAVDIRAFEVAPIDAVAGSLRTSALELLGEASELLAAILEVCDQMEGSTDESVRHSYLSFDDAIDSSIALTPHAVSEIAFIASLELGQRRARLERATASVGSSTLLAECDGALRRVRKALGAVDAAIANSEGSPPRLAFASVLESSLQVRRAYAKFRRGIRAAGKSASLLARFRAAGTQIAVLIGWSAYPEMRVGDRLLLRALQSRLLDWLRGSADAVEGERLWQDLIGFVEMLRLVNRRQELVEHDRSQLDLVAHLLETGEPASDALQALVGLDDDLDAAVETGATAEQLSAAVARLRSRAYGARG